MDNKKRTKKVLRVTLKTLADQVGLTPGTISAVLNSTPASQRIPQRTKDRIFAAAREFKYEPNALARALRTGQTYMAGADAQEIVNARGALVIVGTDQFLRAINAIQQAGLRVPDDVSVLDFATVPLSALDYFAVEAVPKPV
jgi:DNA-binding LacI/PurR family transcriptional regulator